MSDAAAHAVGVDVGGTKIVALRVRMEIEHADRLLDLVEGQLAETPSVPSNE